jgi:octaprenyl-diphosphate synthase
MALVAEFVHSATLLHDDVIDDGMVRRGVSTARRLWGNGVSVLAGDLLLVHALSRTLRTCPEALPGLLSTLRALVEGEVVQMRSRTEPDFSRQVYEQVLQGKTASLFAWATATGARVGGASAEHQAGFASFGRQLGVAFQLVDDVLDYAGEQTGKTALADLCEGKVTLPLVIAMQARPGLEPDVRRVHAGDREPIARVARAVVESGACDQVRQRALVHTKAAVDMLSAFPSSPARLLLEGVAWELTRRTG